MDDENKNPNPPTPLSHEGTPGELVDGDNGELVEEGKGYGNQTVTKIIESMKTTLSKFNLIYTAVNFKIFDKKAGEYKRVTDRFIIANILRTKIFMQTVEANNTTPEDFIAGIIICSIKFNWRAGSVDDATKLAKHWGSIYNDIMIKQYNKPVVKETKNYT